MSFNTQRIKSITLKPVSFLWENVYKVRRSFYEYGIFTKKYFKVPIISIGNITFGGTGKTPMVIWLAGLIEELNLKPMVLTRGYKGELEHSDGILNSGDRFKSNARQYGDEPLLISKNMKRGVVVIGKRRSENLKKYFYKVQPDAVILDDGFQHLKLYRSLNIVLFDALLPLDQYKTAPLGYLREGLTALKDADAIVISRADLVGEEKLNSLTTLISKYTRRATPFAKIKYVSEGIYNIFDEKEFEEKDLRTKNIILVSAIANGQSFYDMVESFGAVIVDRISYSDHHDFSNEDINNLLQMATNHDAIIVSSEKDIVKIKKITQDPRFYYLRISVEFMTGEREILNRVKSTLGFDY